MLMCLVIRQRKKFIDCLFDAIVVVRRAKTYDTKVCHPHLVARILESSKLLHCKRTMTTPLELGIAICLLSTCE